MEVPGGGARGGSSEEPPGHKLLGFPVLAVSTGLTYCRRRYGLQISAQAASFREQESSGLTRGLESDFPTLKFATRSGTKANVRQMCLPGAVTTGTGVTSRACSPRGLVVSAGAALWPRSRTLSVISGCLCEFGVKGL